MKNKFITPCVVASMSSSVREFHDKAEDPNYALCNFCKAKVSFKSGKPVNRQKIKTKKMDSGNRTVILVRDDPFIT